MTDKHHQHLTDMIAETKAEIEKIIEQEKSARKALERIEQDTPKLAGKMKYLLSAKSAYENIMGDTIAEITAPPEPEVEKPKKKPSLFKRLKKDKEPTPEPAPEPEPEPAPDDLEDAIKDL